MVAGPAQSAAGCCFTIVVVRAFDETPNFHDPTNTDMGHHLRPPRHEARADSPAQRPAPGGMVSALPAYSAMSTKMRVDLNVGAELLTMFMAYHEPGGAARIHDHSLEVAFLPSPRRGSYPWPARREQFPAQLRGDGKS
jgi:hypothetical protein